MEILKELPFEVGDEIKNYKAMCELLGEQHREGNSRKAQLRRWKEYFNWHKKGHRFIINKINKKFYPTHDNNRVGQSLKDYNEYIQLLILNFLYIYKKNTQGKVSINISLKGLVGITNLFNHMFYALSFNHEYREKIAKQLNIKETLLREFFQRINSMAQSDVQSALKQLQKKGIIFANEVQLVKPYKLYELGIPVKQLSRMNEFFTKNGDEELIDLFTSAYGVISDGTHQKTMNSLTNKSKHYASRIATDFEQSAILLCGEVASRMLELNGLKHAFQMGRSEEYRKLKQNLMQKYVGIKYAYSGYQIVFSEAILQKSSVFETFKLDEDEIIKFQKLLSDSFEKHSKENLMKNFQNSQDAIINLHGDVFQTYECPSGELKQFQGELCMIDAPVGVRLLSSIDDEVVFSNQLNRFFLNYL